MFFFFSSSHIRGIISILSARRDILGLPAKDDRVKLGKHQCKLCSACFTLPTSLAQHQLIHKPTFIQHVYEKQKQSGLDFQSHFLKNNNSVVQQNLVFLNR